MNKKIKYFILFTSSLIFFCISIIDFYPEKISEILINYTIEQNKNNISYQKMSDNFDKSIALSAACELVFKGREEPSGYTEPVLHQKRLKRVIAIGSQPVSSVFLSKKINNLKKYSLDLYECQNCNLVQFYNLAPLQDM